jgi:quinol monooxygenase YgiN
MNSSPRGQTRLLLVTEHAAVIDVSRYYPAPGKRDELLRAMKQMADRAASSDGCFGAQACDSDQDEEGLVAVSRWESQASLDRFAESPEFVREREQLTSLLSKPARREHLRPR